MMKFCPNYDKEDRLETVLEVPIPEETFACLGSNAAHPYVDNESSSYLSAISDKECMALIKLIGSPLIPLQVQSDKPLIRPIKNCSIEATTGKYIVQQFVAATGGLVVLNSMTSMYAIGQVKMSASEMHRGDVSVHTRDQGESGGFVLWQKNPDMWSLELVVSGFKVNAGSDGKLAWNQSSSQPFHANKGPPRPLRRFFQGLDPRYVANLFQEAIYVGEECVDKDEYCFLLKLETPHDILNAQSTSQTEVVQHSIYGYFSQRTGLLVKFADTKLVEVKPPKGNDSVLWETSIESNLYDYNNVDGIQIAHAGKTVATLNRHGEAHNHKRKIEETWRLEEIGFNICGLSKDCFLPPGDLNREQDGIDS